MPIPPRFERLLFRGCLSLALCAAALLAGCATRSGHPVEPPSEAVESAQPATPAGAAVKLYDEGSPLLIEGAYENDDGGGCAFEWLGRHHPDCRASPTPGLAFAALCGIQSSSIIEAWDADPTLRFQEELISLMRRELFYREPQPCTRRTSGRGSFSSLRSR